MNLFFAGALKSPFIRQNLALLEEDHRVHTFDASITSFLQVPAYLIRAFSQIRQVQQSDALWLWFADYPAIPFVIMGRLLGKPVHVNVGGWEVCNAPGIGYGNQTKIIRGAATRWVLASATTCICPSDDYRKRVLALAPDARVRVVPGWVEPEEPRGLSRSGVLTAYCDYPLAYTIKGIDTFLEATAGMEAGVLCNVSHATLIEALHSAKVYCQLSATESFGMTVLEAMACGCVPVVSDRGALPELVGDAGVVVPYGDVEKTWDGIMTAIQMDGERARMRAGMYNKERARKGIEEVLNETH